MRVPFDHCRDGPNVPLFDGISPTSWRSANKICCWISGARFSRFMIWVIWARMHLATLSASVLLSYNLNPQPRTVGEVKRVDQSAVRHGSLVF